MAALQELAQEDEPGTAAAGLLADLKADPGQLGLETFLAEVAKLERLRGIGLPDGLFDAGSEKVASAWRDRAAKLYPSDLQASARPVRLTLLAALCWSRLGEVTDGMVDLLIALVHRIDARAEQRVEGEMLADLRRVRGKHGILFTLAQVALDHPDDTVRAAVYPVVNEATLRDLVREGAASEQAFRARVRTVLRSSYSAHYRRMLPRLLGSMEFVCNNTAYRPVMDALALLKSYAERSGKQRFYSPTDQAPLEGVVPAEWRDAVVDEHGRVERVPYELCTLRALREAIRRREVWVVGANRWRDPEADLPQDFDANRAAHYAAIRKPLDPTAFVAELRTHLRTSLDGLERALAAGTSGGVRVVTRHGEPWISVPAPVKQAEPANLVALKQQVEARWGTIDLLDVLKEADYLSGFTAELTSVASREATDRATLRRRLLLVCFALGTNMGVKRLADSLAGGSDTEAVLRYYRRLYVSRDNLRAAVRRVVNATFAARDVSLWGAGTACASDSKKFGSWSSNLMTEYHARYGGPGVMIYWHVERKSVCIYSQLKTCSASEVAAMIEGVLRHSTQPKSSATT